jgi:tetratricopeptide (TPR) repeat protein
MWQVCLLVGLFGDWFGTGSTHRVEVSDTPAGIEAKLPRTGAYGRGMRADADLDFASARIAYVQAMDELRRTGERGLAEKAGQQLSLSLTLERAPMLIRQIAPLAGVQTGQWRLPFALAYHEKFLATRAFLGRAVPELAARAEAIYRQILDHEPDHMAARLDLAALYAERGELVAAEAEFARVPESTLRDATYAIEAARYLAARGRVEEAIVALERAQRKRPGELRELWLQNGFDRLRRDARFLGLVGMGERRSR